MVSNGAQSGLCRSFDADMLDLVGMALGMLAMVYRGFRSLSPAGLLIDDIEAAPDRLVIRARCRAAVGNPR